MQQFARNWFLVGCFTLCLACSNGSIPYETLEVGGGGAADGEGGGAGGEGGTTGTSSRVVPDYPWLSVAGNRIVDEAGEPVVLRGVSTIDLGSTEEYEGGLLTMIDRLTERDDPQGNSPGWYPTVIRLAIYPADEDATASPFTFSEGSDAFYENLLRPAVDRAKERGAYAIVDWHYIAVTSDHRDTTAAFWTYMAPKFAEDPNVIFELFNEPENRTWSSVKQDMQTWFDIVRAGAPKNLVLVGTPSWCQDLADTATDPVEGENIAYVAHLYPLHFTWDDTVTGVEAANAVHPVFLTEWGYEAGASEVVDGDQESYAEPFKAWAEEQGMSHVAWCASDSWYPRMFDASYGLLVGSEFMGGFAKDWMYEKRSENAPFPVE